MYLTFVKLHLSLINVNQLKNGYNYLKFTRKMKFPDLQEVQRRRDEEQRLRQVRY